MSNPERQITALELDNKSSSISTDAEALRAKSKTWGSETFTANIDPLSLLKQSIGIAEERKRFALEAIQKENEAQVLGRLYFNELSNLVLAESYLAQVEEYGASGDLNPGEFSKARSVYAAMTDNFRPTPVAQKNSIGKNTLFDNPEDVIPQQDFILPNKLNRKNPTTEISIQNNGESVSVSGLNQATIFTRFLLTDEQHPVSIEELSILIYGATSDQATNFTYYLVSEIKKAVIKYGYKIVRNGNDNVEYYLKNETEVIKTETENKPVPIITQLVLDKTIVTINGKTNKISPEEARLLSVFIPTEKIEIESEQTSISIATNATGCDAGKIGLAKKMRDLEHKLGFPKFGLFTTLGRGPETKWLLHGIEVVSAIE